MKKAKTALLVASPIFIAISIAAYLFYHGILLFNNPSVQEYPVRGVDVSSYQGDIDWEILGGQGIYFAFIKATEGSSFTDKYFKANFENALNSGLKVGAYHFFSFDSSGKTQAENFIAHVPKIDGALPPVVDFEFYGYKEKNMPEKEAARTELNILLNELEAHYEVKPIIYATEKAYKIYLSGHYEAYDIWIRNVFTRPNKLNNQTWKFWQYTNRARLDGYKGIERYIDMNVFNGTLEEFNNYAK